MTSGSRHVGSAGAMRSGKDITVIRSPRNITIITASRCRNVPVATLFSVLLAIGGCATYGEVDRQGEDSLEFAEHLADQRRFDEASSILELEVARRGDDPTAFHALLMLAEIRERRGDHAGAVGALERAEAMKTALHGEDATQGGKEPVATSDSIVVDPKVTQSEAIAAIDDSRTPRGATPGETRITNSFFDTDLRQVLTDLSFDAEVPILWDPTVQGLVTYEAIDQPLDFVLRAVLVPLGYTYTYDDGSYWVGSAKPDGPAFGSLSRTRVVPLANIEAEKAIRLLNDYFTPYVKANNTGNLVCITAPPTVADRIEADLAAIDAPRELVMIEVVMAEISETGMRQIGFDWYAKGPSGRGTWEFGTALDGIEDPGIMGTIEQVGIAATDWTARLEALVMDGKAEIRASPRITTLNGRPAGISLTRDQYFIIQTGTGMGYNYNTLESVSSGIKLEITPFVSEDRNVTVYVKPEVGDVTGSSPTSALPEISWRRANTVIRVQDGQTFSIGGLNLEQEKTIQKKVPLLGDVPLLGALFRYESKETKKSEVVLFLTPHILEG